MLKPPSLSFFAVVLLEQLLTHVATQNLRRVQNYPDKLTAEKSLDLSFNEKVD